MHRPDISDALDAMTPRWDALVARARLCARSSRELHGCEEDAQRFADELIAAFRGAGARRPSVTRLMGREGLGG